LVKTVFTQARLAWRLLRDPRVRLWAKAVPVLAAVYLISPLDFIPDVLPIIGQVDDLAIALLAVQFFVHLCPPAVVAFHRDAIAQGHRFSRMPAGGQVIEAEFRRES